MVCCWQITFGLLQHIWSVSTTGNPVKYFVNRSQLRIRVCSRNTGQKISVSARTRTHTHTDTHTRARTRTHTHALSLTHTHIHTRCYKSRPYRNKTRERGKNEKNAKKTHTSWRYDLMYVYIFEHKCQHLHGYICTTRVLLNGTTPLLINVETRNQSVHDF